MPRSQSRRCRPGSQFGTTGRMLSAVELAVIEVHVHAVPSVVTPSNSSWCCRPSAALIRGMPVSRVDVGRDEHARWVVGMQGDQAGVEGLVSVERVAGVGEEPDRPGGAVEAGEVEAMEVRRFARSRVVGSGIVPTEEHGVRVVVLVDLQIHRPSRGPGGAAKHLGQSTRRHGGAVEHVLVGHGAVGAQELVSGAPAGDRCGWGSRGCWSVVTRWIRPEPSGGVAHVRTPGSVEQPTALAPRRAPVDGDETWGSRPAGSGRTHTTFAPWAIGRRSSTSPVHSLSNWSLPAPSPEASPGPARTPATASGGPVERFEYMAT